MGSSPAIGGAPGLGPGGRRFESCLPDKTLRIFSRFFVFTPYWILSDTLFSGMSYFVYILQSLKDYKYYIGSTSDVQARIKFHNSGLQRSTRNRIPFRLVLFEEYETKEEALKREKQIKSWKGGEPFKRLVYGK